jgi:hypothetical protein
MKNIKYNLGMLNPKEVFLRASYRILKLRPKPMHIITKLVNHLMVVWHVVKLARTRTELRRMNPKKSDFPYEDYSAYM